MNLKGAQILIHAVQGCWLGYVLTLTHGGHSENLWNFKESIQR